MAQLESDIAAETAQSQAANATDAAASASTAQTAPVQPKKEGVETPKADAKPGAPATAENQPKSPEENKQSKFAADKQRRDDSWKALNAEKEETRALRKRCEEDLAALKRERQALEEEKTKAAQPKFKPEEYETKAAEWERLAGVLEGEGKFEEAAVLKYRARVAKEYAADLRKNPPPAPKTDEQAKADSEKVMKEWYSKGALECPAAAKYGTPENAKLQELIKAEPGLLEDPKAMYYGLRLVTAETAAARASSLEKDLGEARAKIKELEGKLTVTDGNAPPGNLAPVAFEQKGADEQWAELQQMAAGMPT